MSEIGIALYSLLIIGGIVFLIWIVGGALAAVTIKIEDWINRE